MSFSVNNIQEYNIFIHNNHSYDYCLDYKHNLLRIFIYMTVFSDIYTM